MNASRLFLVSLFAALTSIAARAEQAAPAIAMHSTAPSAQSAQDCAKANTAHHDHSAMEMGGGSMALKPCAPATTASAVKPNQPHDQANPHKNQ